MAKGVCPYLQQVTYAQNAPEACSALDRGEPEELSRVNRVHIEEVGLTPSERRQTPALAGCISMRSWERQGACWGSERLGWGTEEFGATAPFRVS